MNATKANRRIKRKKRIQVRIKGTKQRPRLVVRRSLRNIFAQIVDDETGKTLFSLSTLDKEVQKKFSCGGNVKAALYMGDTFAKKAKEKGITKVVFDRCGYIYHGRIKAFADACRKGGLEF